MERQINLADTTKNPEVIQSVAKDRAAYPTTLNQVGGWTKPGSRASYLRRFAIDQGLDSTVNLVLHESLHGAGAPLQGQLFEGFHHRFEAAVGFPQVSGLVDVTRLTLSQPNKGGYDIHAEFSIYKRPEEERLKNFSVVLVDQNTGKSVMANGKPVQTAIEVNDKRGAVTLHVDNLAPGTYSLRFYPSDPGTIAGSRDLTIPAPSPNSNRSNTKPQ